MYTYDTLICDIEEGIAQVTINRPDSLNALNSQVFAELGMLFDGMKNDGNVRVVIITGAGKKAFVAGADIMEIRECSVIEGRKISLLANRTQKTIEDFPKPVIAAINGFALGGGLELAMTCDMRIASENARFGQPEINIGLIPGGGGTQRLSRLIGVEKAKWLIYTGEMINAEQACAMGLVHTVVSPEELIPEARKLALKLAGKSQIILSLAKQAINNGIQLDLDRALQLEIECFANCFGTEDRDEGISSFIEKRKPEFRDK
jgi:enoyl-CoA hydratase